MKSIGDLDTYQKAAAKSPAAAVVFPRLCDVAIQHGLILTRGDGSIELTHKATGTPLLRLRANARIEIPFDTMSSRNKAFDAGVRKSIIARLADAGFDVAPYQHKTWPGIPAEAVLDDPGAQAISQIFERLIRCANSVKT